MVRAISICVDYHDIIEMTLPSHKFLAEETLIVTAPRDKKTVEIAEANGAKVHVTDVFYRGGAYFNKWAALEEGLSVMGRDGWILIVDADIVIPEHRHTFIPQEGFIYTPHRRIKEDISDGVPEQRKWTQYKRPSVNEEFGGYFQLFHGSDPMLGPAPWHATDWKWAAGADVVFHNKWPMTKRVRTPFEVLHLGPAGVNWAGRTSRYKDGTYDEKTKVREERRDRLLKSRRQSGPLDRFRREKLGNTEE